MFRLSNKSITSGAQQPSHFTGKMVMVHIKIPVRRFRTTANSAFPALNMQEEVVVRYGRTISVSIARPPHNPRILRGIGKAPFPRRLIFSLSVFLIVFPMVFFSIHALIISFSRMRIKQNVPSADIFFLTIPIPVGIMQAILQPLFFVKG